MIGLNRRRTMGSALPYDAEIEYLESTGTQWINTMFTILKDDFIELEFQFLDNIGSIVFGSRARVDTRKVTIGNSSTGNIYASLGGTSNTTLLTYDYNKHKITINTLNGKAKIDDSTEQSVGTYVDNRLNNYLFACNEGGTTKFFSKAKIYSLKIYRDGACIFNLSPVRKGQVGYMYDKVSGQLFGNSGTGSFILGPDK